MTTGDFLRLEFLGGPIREYLVAIATLLAGLLVINLLRRIVIGRLRLWASRTSTDLDDRLVHLIERPILGLLYLGTLYVSLQDILQNADFPKVFEEAITVVSLTLGTLLAIQLIGSITEYGLRLYWVTRRQDVLMQQTLQALIPALKVVIWTVGIIFLLDNLGLDVSAAVTSLGIGGVALALASQGILADMFSYFAILFDRPFEIGDLIKTGEVTGTVETVGIKTTRLRSVTGEEVIIANTDLTGSRIQNYKRMTRRRMLFQLTVPYNTPPEKLQRIPGLIQTAVEATEQTCFDRAHFSAYGEFGLNYEVVYFVESSDYTVYMNAHQSINLAIKQAFEQENILFAHQPTLSYMSSPSYSGNGSSNPHIKVDENAVIASNSKDP
ncbi:MAG TPA: mechanosensitive ion channel family protein [Leptolyngbyaceae cyanobacterium]